MKEGPQEVLNQTEFAQPAIFATSYIAFLQYKSQNDCKFLKFLIGNSMGEYTALTAAGWLNPLNTVKLLRYRGQLMQEACIGRKCGMLIVMETEEKTSDLLKEIKNDSNLKGFICELAVYNSEKNHVFTGDIEILSVFSSKLKKAKILNLFLKVSAAFHCSLLEKIMDPFECFLKKIEINVQKNGPKIVRNYDLKVYESVEDVIEGLVKQMNHPVLFYQSVRKVAGEVKEIVEFASNKTQVRVLQDILKNKEEKIKISSF